MQNNELKLDGEKIIKNEWNTICVLLVLLLQLNKTLQCCSRFFRLNLEKVFIVLIVVFSIANFAISPYTVFCHPHILVQTCVSYETIIIILVGKGTKTKYDSGNYREKNVRRGCFHVFPGMVFTLDIFQGTLQVFRSNLGVVSKILFLI